MKEFQFPQQIISKKNDLSLVIRNHLIAQGLPDNLKTAKEAEITAKILPFLANKINS